MAFIREALPGGLCAPGQWSRTPARTRSTLFEGGKILIRQDGLGAWHESLQRQQTVNPKFNLQPVMPFAHDGGTPIIWGGDPAGIFTFVKKGLGEDRVEELLGVMNYTAAPFGTEEYQLYNYGVEGKHYTEAAVRCPEAHRPGPEGGRQTYIFLGGRPTAITESEYPGYVESMSAWQNAAAKVREKNLFDGHPGRAAGQDGGAEPAVRRQALQDIFRGRRPISELKTAVKEWQDQRRRRRPRLLRQGPQ